MFRDEFQQNSVSFPKVSRVGLVGFLYDLGHKFKVPYYSSFYSTQLSYDETLYSYSNLVLYIYIGITGY